ncbi:MULTISPECIES: carbohydrate ABC transporter permease [Clostridium]|uniref:carbohydrate ABC transporter permease n=1 Tax=Clostridium TaxID=1485 RepID=UPI00115B9E94|nr:MULTISPECIES: sugar ABC transporter permease [Clostridium]MBS5306118.1 sugar ABC transporter permease [Clostridium sp.]MDB1934374.1 sugar ABC transporter permease [Clostridium tertium]MDB1935875.1 sugar ABC transporter permease [Clostridium tertium]MDB1944545.1 sugar ABC transporter permease [Clostridium tertium]MDB1951812.1 sugar ABC transporter permease [Clostridium tertium]
MKRSNKNRSLNYKLDRKAWLFVIPSIILVTVFVFYPMIQAFITSLQSGMGNNLSFVGIDNYKRLLTDSTFKKALFNTVLYLIIQVPIMIILALVISAILNDKKLKARGFFRTAIFLPCVTSLVAYSIIFKSLFATDGFVNAFLMNINVISEPIAWITHPIWARILIIIAITWRWTGYNMVFYLAGMQSIDDSIYEAAEIDGASAFMRFKSITLPLLKPIILFTTINSTIGTLQLFDETVNITNGGPANATITISQYIYNLLFKYSPNFGYAAAISYVIVLIIVILSFIQLKAGGDKDE